MVKYVAGETRVNDLLSERSKDLKTLSDLVAHALPAEPLEDGVFLDDIFLLRYLLSYKTPEKAKDPVITCLQWRKENQGLLTALAENNNHPLAARFQRFQVSGVSGVLGGGEPVAIVRLGLCDLRGLMSEFELEEVAEYLLFEKEKIWRMCDDATRKSGYLVKSITVIDFANFSLFGSKSDNRFFKALGKSSKLSSLYYPQLQAKTVSINTPKYYNMVHKTLSAVMPKSSMEKMVVCPAKRSSTKSASNCPFMTMYDGVAAVPDFLGGTASCPRELMAVRPDEYGDEGSLSTMWIKPRSKEQVVLHIAQAGSIVEFKVSVEKKHIMLGANLVPEDAIEKDDVKDQSDDEPLGRSESQVSRSASKVSQVESRPSRTGSKISHSGSRTSRSASISSIGSRIRSSVSRRASRKGYGSSGSTDGKDSSTRNLNLPLPDEIVEDEEEPVIRRGSRRWTLSPAMKPQEVRDTDGLLQGTWKVSRAGKFVVTFDNSFSLLTGKRVSYKLNVVDPPTDKEEASWWRDHWTEYLGFVTSGWENDPENERTCALM